jgi:hypothetical protein
METKLDALIANCAGHGEQARGRLLPLYNYLPCVALLTRHSTPLSSALSSGHYAPSSTTVQLISTFCPRPSSRFSTSSLSPSLRLTRLRPIRHGIHARHARTHAHVYEPPPAPPFNLRLAPPLSRVVATTVKLDVHVASACATSGALDAGSWFARRGLCHGTRGRLRRS